LLTGALLLDSVIVPAIPPAVAGISGKARAQIPVPSQFRLFQSYNLAIRVFGDTTNSELEATYANNLSNQKPSLYNLLRVNSVAANLVLDSGVTLNYDAGTFTQPNFLRLQRIINPQKISQPDNQFVRLRRQPNAAERYAYSFSGIDSSVIFQRPLTLTFAVESGEFSSNRSFINGYVYSEGLLRWLKMTNQVRLNDSTLSLNIANAGSYTLMYSDDNLRPTASIGIEGQSYVPGTAVNRRPRIIVNVQDRNGVYADKNLIRVIRDGDSSDALRNNLIVPQSAANANSLPIVYEDQFEPGKHTLRFQFNDANLNSVSTETLQFDVSDEFSLKVYGVYPNPFKDLTYISYEIAGENAENFEVKIYTTSGRLISTCREPGNRPAGFLTGRGLGDDNGALANSGAHALAWDGRDEAGNEVTNGVYYAKIRVSFQGKTLEKMLKVVRLR
jgi:hypothetical protein